MPPSDPPAALAELQRGFLAFVTGRREVPSELGHARADLTVYRRMYALRMAREVAREFPATRALLGAAAFDRIARAYVAAHPSTSFTLERYAARLPGLLRGAAARLAAVERSIFEHNGTRIRVAPREAAFLRALLRGAELERAAEVALDSGLAPREIRRAVEHWVGSGLFGSPLPRNLARHLSLPCDTFDG
jgi:hypothetical protein